MSTIDDVVRGLIDGLPAAVDRHGQVACSTDMQTSWAVVRDCEGRQLTQGQLDRASIALRHVRGQARAWHWEAVGHALDAGYLALGAENPADGYDYHCGLHPACRCLD